MRKLLLLAAVLLWHATPHAQNVLLNEAFSVSPNDWFYGQGMQLKTYNNPFNNCGADQGFMTAAIGHYGTPSYVGTKVLFYDASTPNLIVRFKMFVFDANAQCGSFKPFPCASYVKIYLVDGSYTSSAPPPSNVIFAQSTAQLMVANAVNTVSFPSALLSAMATGTEYRVYIDFDVPVNCNQNNTKYVIDDIIVLEQAGIILPVHFGAFTASRSRNEVLLNWTTTTESDNKGFYVQRNYGNQDWKTLGFIETKAPQGNSAADILYSFTDVNNYNGVSQYRIVQEDMNGKTRYSEVRFVRGQSQAENVLVFPNPARNGQVNILFSGATGVKEVTVYDLSGRMVRQIHDVTTQGLKISQLEAGLYTLQVREVKSGAVQAFKLMVAKN
jgi:hypothetical protein